MYIKLDNLPSKDDLFFATFAIVALILVYGLLAFSISDKRFDKLERMIRANHQVEQPVEASPHE